MSDPQVLVRAEGLRRRYGPVVAVDGVSFEVRRGEMFGLIGPDGAGKTTTLRVLLGLLRPDGGSARLCGFDPFQKPREIARRTGYLSQRFSLYGDLSVDENAAFFAAVHGVPGWRARRDELLELLRLRPFRGRLADRLSGGMKQKLALACTLIHTPEILVLDEPTTGVDPVSRRDFWAILGRLQRQGLTILLTTPYLDEAERCTRIALIAGGHLLTVDAPDDLRRRATSVILEVLARPRRRALQLLGGRPGVADVQTFGERLHLTLAEPAPPAPEAADRITAFLLSAGLEVESVRPVRPSLEDIFIARIRAGDPGPTGAREVHS